MEKKNYEAVISSDWNECLSPMGPFDPIVFAYPEIKPDLKTIFQAYTSNKISLSKAVQGLEKLLPAPINADQMDAYLETHFETYRGVPEFMKWCMEKNVLFMINTTASIGFFQRVFAKGLLPEIPILSAHPGIRFPHSETDPKQIYELREISDKAINTSLAARLHDIPFTRVIVIGDSGGDGPHFEWGAENGAFLIGSMTKTSLVEYCEQKGIKIDLFFGLRYDSGQVRDIAKEMAVDFTQLKEVVRMVLQR